MLKNLNPKNPMRLLVPLALFGLLVVLPLGNVYLRTKDLSRHAKLLSSAYKSQNFDLIKQEVIATKMSMSSVDSSLKFLIWLNLVPFVGGYYRDASGLSEAGFKSLNAVSTILESLEPSKVELGFTGQQIAGQDRITQALKILDKSLPYIPKIEGDLKQAALAVEKMDVNKYPENFRGFALRGNIKTSKNFIIGSYQAITKSKPALEVIPTLLGQSGEKTYLLLFQNDKEIRATGGFITAYAFLKIDKGTITTTQSDDIYHLDEKLLSTCKSKICPLTPPAPIVKYLPEVSGKPRSAWSMRDSNISPDVPTSAKEFERMYQLLGEGLPFDGIIFIDSQVVEQLIEVTGPIDVYGVPYSANNDHRCNCPNVIFELENYAEVVAKGEKDRKAILGVLMSQLLTKSVGVDVEKVPQFITTIVNLANGKHVLFYLHDEKAQSAFSTLNWIGQIKDYDGDYLHINDSNFAGGKSNLYVDQVVTQEVSYDKDGIKKKLTIDYKNPEPFNTWLNGINRDYIRIYVPRGSKLISSKGSEDQVNTIEDLDKTVFEAFITVRPQNSRKLEFEYAVPYDPKGEYKLMIQKQPGAKDFKYKIKLNGKQMEDFVLDSDKQFSFNW